MIQAMPGNTSAIANDGHKRSVKLKRNILHSAGLKGASVLISLALIPLSMAYVNKEQYGVWLTLSSVIAWTAFFDVGLGNGLRNKLTAAIALDDLVSARRYVSTTYFIIMLIAVVLFGAFALANPYINWSRIINTPLNLQSLMLLMFGFFCINFVLQLIGVVVTANQQPAISAVINVSAQALSLISIFVLTKTGHGTLQYLLWAITGAQALAFVVASVYLFAGSYRYLAPSVKAIDLGCVKELFSSGSVFLVIQLGALVLYETDNIVITQLFGPAEVTTFNIAYKLFSVVILVFTVVVTPYWSAFTDAYTRNDSGWIKQSMHKISKVWKALSLAALLLLLASPVVYKLWLGADIAISLQLSAIMCLYTIVSMWQTKNVYLLNGTGKIKLQLYLVSVGAIINIPLAVFLGRYLGVAGVTLSNALLFVAMGSVFALQAKRVVNGTAKGIFNR